MACCSTWTRHPVLARVLGFNCAVHLTGIYSQAVQAVRLVAIRLSRSPIIMTHFVAVAQRTANSRGSLHIPWMASHVPRLASHVRRPTHPAAGCSIFACLLFRLRHFDFLICLVAFCIHLPLHFICQHCITLSGIFSGKTPGPCPCSPFAPALAALLTIAAPATARQNYLLGKIKSFALLCGAEGVGWNGRVSQTRESLKLGQGHSAPTCPDPPDLLMAANSRNYCGKGKQRRKHCLTFNALPICILLCFRNC